MTFQSLSRFLLQFQGEPINKNALKCHHFTVLEFFFYFLGKNAHFKTYTTPFTLLRPLHTIIAFVLNCAH